MAGSLGVSVGAPGNQGVLGMCACACQRWPPKHISMMSTTCKGTLGQLSIHYYCLD